jgi:hypothetical protein
MLCILTYRLSLPLLVLHYVTIHVFGVVGEVDRSNFEALGLFMSTPEPAPEGYELHS